VAVIASFATLKPRKMTSRSRIFSSRTPAARLKVGQTIVVLAAGVICSFAVFASMPSGPLGRHMAVHILLMNALAPLAALLAVHSVSRSTALGGGWLVLATFLQIAGLWGWHAPPVLEATLSSTPLHLTMQLSLFATASLFWFAILFPENAGRWRPILALLITSKLYCLLGALLIFAPQSVYPNIDVSHAHQLVAGSTLIDQQTAGLLMLIACPLTYVSAGIIMTAQWLRDLAGTNAELLVLNASIRSSNQGR
jgi:putative membrane protein